MNQSETAVSPRKSSDEPHHRTTSLLENEETCSTEELDALFQIKWRIADQEGGLLKKSAILNLAADSGFTRVAAGLPRGRVHLFDIHSSKTVSTFTNIPIVEDYADTCGVRYLDETPNCLLIGTRSGIVRLFDLRTQKEEARFESNCKFKNKMGLSKYRLNTINCFDINSNGRILCSGTKRTYDNVFLLFYDVRERKLLGSYYDSHQDSITSVRFHATNPDLMCSGSADGLINIYDLKETTEADALLTSINTQSSVRKISWHKNANEHDLISCITYTNDFHIYLAEEGDTIAKFKRFEITEAARLTNGAHLNVIDVHSLENGDLFLLTGTHDRSGKVMRTLCVNNNNLLPMSDFQRNKQAVLSSLFDKKNGIMLTGGVHGFVTLWTTQGKPTKKDKQFKYRKSKRDKPY